MPQIDAVAVPVPDNDTVPGELEALLTKLILPVTAPAIVGAKAAVKVLLCPTARVKGRVRPVTE